MVPGGMLQQPLFLAILSAVLALSQSGVPEGLDRQQDKIGLVRPMSGSGRTSDGIVSLSLHSLSGYLFLQGVFAR